MANIEGMEMKYTVIKNEDLKKTSLVVQNMMNDVISAVDWVRTGKKENTYLVINTDEPYADEVIEILKRNGHWGNERTQLIRQLGEKACDRNDKALMRMEECKVDKNQIIVNGRIFPFNFPVIFYGEAVSLAGGEDGRLYTVTYSVVRGNDGKQGSLVEGQSIEIVDGMVLNVSQTDKA